MSQESKIKQNTIGLQERESWNIEKLFPTLQFCLLPNLESQVRATQNPLGPWILLQAILAVSVAESETYYSPQPYISDFSEMTKKNEVREQSVCQADLCQKYSRFML